jgi:hypothetical protein
MTLANLAADIEPQIDTDQTQIRRNGIAGVLKSVKIGVNLWLRFWG